MGVATASPPTLTPVFSAPRGSSRRPFPRRGHRHLHFLKSSSLNITTSVFVQKKWNQKPFTKSSIYRISCSLLEVKDGTDDESCELVNGVEISVRDGTSTTDDSINAHLFKAVKNNNGTGILLLSDIFGFEDSATKDFAYRVACNGYNVLVPDLFRGDPWTKEQTNTTFEEWMARQDPNRVAKDIEASTKWMVDEFVAAGISKKLGIIGFSYGGGRLIEVLARDGGVCFGVGVSFYGTRIMDPSLASGIQVPVLFVSGDNDSFCPVDVLKDFEKRIGSGSKAVIFNGRGHGFAHRPGSPEEDGDAEEAFMIMRNWLYDGLIANI